MTSCEVEAESCSFKKARSSSVTSTKNKGFSPLDRDNPDTTLWQMWGSDFLGAAGFDPVPFCRGTVRILPTLSPLPSFVKTGDALVRTVLRTSLSDGLSTARVELSLYQIIVF